MDSRLAADPVVRHILELLTTLEKAAGVRAHYRILDSPPLVSLDLSSIHTVARVLSDWIGLRNAIFNITLVADDQPPRLVRIDPDQEEFAMELPAGALATTDCALAIIARQVARAYLITSNIAGSSIDPARTGGSLADVTAIFLGMGKLLLNAPAAGQVSLRPGKRIPDEAQPLSATYLAFTHRVVCSMRGLDWSRHAGGISQEGIAALRKWDGYRDTVFSQALRNVLTASASHRPLMDAIEDNHLALARFDQLQRTFLTTVLQPLMAEVEQYHRTCREGMEHLAAREQDTYDPCLLYLNQLRRRMDLQRYADMLLTQQDHIIGRLRTLTAGLGDLDDRRLVHPDGAAARMHKTRCPFDGTEITIHDANQDSRVRCPTCAYTFLATSGLPAISALQRLDRDAAAPAETSRTEATSSTRGKKPEKTRPAEKSASKTGSAAAEELPTKQKKQRSAARVMLWGIVLMPVAWLPMLVYFFVQLAKGEPAPLIGELGRIGVVGSVVACVIVALGFLIWLGSIMRRNPAGDVQTAETPSDTAVPPADAKSAAIRSESAEPLGAASAEGVAPDPLMGAGLPGQDHAGVPAEETAP